MSTKPEKADDDIDALEALESEEKEYLKVRQQPLFHGLPLALQHLLICSLPPRMLKLIES
jgi:hypothetical protein